MKKTAKLLTLAVAIFAGSVGTAQAEGFKVGADVVSSYVWRGGELGNSPAIQPALSYTLPGSGIVVGGWGSYAISQDAGTRYKEVDLFATIPVGPLSFTVTDYYTSTATSRSFDFTNDGPNIVELSVAYAKENVSLLAAINVAGNNTGANKNAKYCEAGYKFYDKDGYTAKGVVGLGDEDVYGDKQGDKIAVVNTGVSVSKDRYTASYIYNPDTEASHLVFMASF
ncbi:hypothetical protein G9409_07040 [Chlorobium sp. BLA1]|uniref:hypothetical protein n=1 Tax=Candidatus Chlorobium masyuteum TaxID=2716876 RepID=UPI00141FB276|nr:hypothetical protein [Candidatus Chlorobium masyuteum]NHQ60346.1 hypothetical protein [Candidatus Chlorobium masyuteum]NTU44082.1 hypothetical protein [Chlorobiaceae bacterium]